MCPLCRVRFSARGTYPVHLGGIRVGENERYHLEFPVMVFDEELPVAAEVELPAVNDDDVPLGEILIQQNERNQLMDAQVDAIDDAIPVAAEVELPAINDHEIFENDELPAENNIELLVANGVEIPLVEEAVGGNIENQLALDLQVAIDLQLAFDIADAPEVRDHPKRAKRTTSKLNYKMFTCVVCTKRFQVNDYPSLDDGQHVCSYSCLKKK